jgi:nitroreductase
MRRRLYTVLHPKLLVDCNNYLHPYKSKFSITAYRTQYIYNIEIGDLFMDAFEAIENRRSVRKYKPKTISKEIIEKLINAARLAPSAINIQPWEFIAITNTETLNKIADITDHGKFIANAPLCIAIFCRDTKYYLEDGTAAVENILIAATALGLGTCWVAGDKKTYANEIRELLSVPIDHKLVALVPIGYPDDDSNSKSKREVIDVLHFEKF